MRTAAALLLCGLLAQLAAAGPEIKPLPPPEPAVWKEVRVTAGELEWFEAAPASTWDFIDDGIKGRAVEDGKLAGLVCAKGRHRVIVTARDGSRSRYVFVAGDREPGPVPPLPSPDALVRDLAAAHAAEPPARRKADMAALAELYRLMVVEARDPAYATAAALNARFIAARDRMLSDPDPTPEAPDRRTPVRLPLVRKRAGQEVAAVIGDREDTALTPELRRAVAAVYERLAAAVTEVAK